MSETKLNIENLETGVRLQMLALIQPAGTEPATILKKFEVMAEIMTRNTRPLGLIETGQKAGKLN